MSWLEIKPQRGISLKLIGPVVQMSAHGGRVNIRFTGELLAQLGVKIGDQVTILRGSGEHAGAMRIFAGSGYSVRKVKTGDPTGLLAIPAWPEVAKEERPAKTVAFRIEETPLSAKTLHLTLPAWASPDFVDAAVRKPAHPPIPLLK